MKIFRVKLKLVDILIALVILSISFVAIYFAFDPKQAAAKKHDSQFSPTAKTIQSAITDYFERSGTAFSSSFGFMKGSEAVKVLGVENNFANNEFIMANLKDFYIGKEKGPEASFYVCFAPESRFVRDSNCNDSFVYTLNSDGTRTPVKCGLSDSWPGGDSPWVVCTPK